MCYTNRRILYFTLLKTTIKFPVNSSLDHSSFHFQVYFYYSTCIYLNFLWHGGSVGERGRPGRHRRRRQLLQITYKTPYNNSYGCGTLMFSNHRYAVGSVPFCRIQFWGKTQIAEFHFAES